MSIELFIVAIFSYLFGKYEDKIDKKFKKILHKKEEN